MHLPLAIIEGFVLVAFDLGRHLLRLFEHGIDLVIAAHVGHELNGAADFIHAVVAIAHELIVFVFGGHEVAVVGEKGDVEDARVPAGEEDVGRLGAALFAELHDLFAHLGRLHEGCLLALFVDVFHVLEGELRGGLLIGVLEEVKGFPLLPIAPEEIHLDDGDLEHVPLCGFHRRGLDVENEQLVGGHGEVIAFLDWGSKGDLECPFSGPTVNESTRPISSPLDTLRTPVTLAGRTL